MSRFWSPRIPFSVIIQVALIPLLVLTSAVTNAQSRVWISADGNDDWSGLAASPDGSGNGPKRTFLAARTLVRLLKFSNTISPLGAIVTVKPGRYKVPSSFVLDYNDSGKSGARIIWRSEAVGKAILDGGREIKKWLPADNLLPELHMRFSIR